MIFKDFNLSLDRLKAEWPKAYGNEKGKELWKMFQYRDAEEMSFAVSEALKKSKYAPTLSELQTYGADYGRQVYGGHSQKRCVECSGSGWVLMNIKPNTAKPCQRCRAGAKLKPIVEQELKRHQIANY